MLIQIQNFKLIFERARSKIAKNVCVFFSKGFLFSTSFQYENFKKSIQSCKIMTLNWIPQEDFFCVSLKRDVCLPSILLSEGRN